ncbi:MAG: hypothetical protein SGARI_001845, partial [Bacillariaceae sp.]
MKFSASILIAFAGTASAFAPSKMAASTTSQTQLFSATETEVVKGSAGVAKVPKRVVVTGLGVVNGCGVGHEDFFKACLEGKSSIDHVKRFDISHMPCQIGSEVPDEIFDPKEWFTNPKNVKSNDRYTHLAVAAARMALKDAELGDTPETLLEPEMMGVMVGTAFGGMETFEQQTLKLAKNPEKPKVRL